MERKKGDPSCPIAERADADTSILAESKKGKRNSELVRPVGTVGAGPSPRRRAGRAALSLGFPQDNGDPLMLIHNAHVPPLHTCIGLQVSRQGHSAVWHRAAWLRSCYSAQVRHLEHLHWENGTKRQSGSRDQRTWMREWEGKARNDSDISRRGGLGWAGWQHLFTETILFT